MASRLVIKGGRPLVGSLEASGAKNACLPIMAASQMLGLWPIFCVKLA